MKAILLLITMLINESLEISFVLRKKSVYIPENSHYLSNIFVERQNAELIPINMSVQTTVLNSIPSYNNYFDYFHLLTPEDITCYENSVNNRSYLYPCAFVNSRNTLKRSNYVQSQRYNQSVEEINNLNFSFIIDNTLFPYPSGAYGYSPLKVDVELTVVINVSSSFEILGKCYDIIGTRLIYITATVFLIFITIITTLVCKTRRINKQMQTSNMTLNARNNLQSVMNRNNTQSSSDDDEKDGNSSSRQLKEKLLQPEESEIEKIEDNLNQRKSMRPFGEKGNEIMQ